jgi:hypothetical protein
MSPSLPDPPESLQAVENKIKLFEESNQALKYYRNTLVPISSLPNEVLITIFSFGVALPSFGVLKSSLRISPFSISHVCHRWRKISLDLTHLWSQINFTKLTPTGTAEMLARAKMAPLHLEAVTKKRAIIEGFEGQIKAHIHHTRHLRISAPQEQLEQMLEQLVSSAPSLEQLSVTNLNRDSFRTPFIPNNIFNGKAPKLIYLRLVNCRIHWWSPIICPLLEGLRNLELCSCPKNPIIIHRDFVYALKQMPKLERLTLHDGVSCSPASSLSIKPSLTVVLPFLNELDISASARDCRVVLAHFVLPVLTRLFIKAESNHQKGKDVLYLTPHVVRNTHGPQDADVLQSLFIGGDKSRAEIVAWNVPGKDTDDELCSSARVPDGISLARVAFSTVNKTWRTRMDVPLFDALLTALPLNSIVNLTVKGRTPLSRQVWRNHAPRWQKLRRVRLFPTAVPAFGGVIEDALCSLSGSPLPALEELVLMDVSLNAAKVYYLINMLNDLVKLKISLKKLDLRTCIASDRAVQLLGKIVVDVQVPVTKESNEERQGSTEVLGEEGRRDEGEHESDDVPPLVGSWDVDYDDNIDVDDAQDSVNESSSGSELYVSDSD